MRVGLIQPSARADFMEVAKFSTVFVGICGAESPKAAAIAEAASRDAVTIEFDDFTLWRRMISRSGVVQ